MPNTWAKVCSFLDMVDIQDLHSPFLVSSRSSSFSSSSNSDVLPSPKKSTVGEDITQKILSIIQPTVDSEQRRKCVIEYIQTLLEDAFGIKVFPFGSVPLKTYLPHGDVDLTAVSHDDPNEGLAVDICNLLQDEERNNTRIQVRDVAYIPAQVRVVKCTVDDVAVDISFNQTAGLCALCFLEQVDQFIGKDHLFKRSVILIKAWCYYESRILGGFHGLISTYALETLVLHVINHFHSSLNCPLSVLSKFLEYYSTFDWGRYCVAIDGIVLISSLPEITVLSPHECDELLLTNEFLRNSREAFLSYTGVLKTKQNAFPTKFLNILDPLRDDNNLGRSVSKGNFYRIRSALCYGTRKLGDVLILPPEEIGKGLEFFFVNTLERNGRGNRADVRAPVPDYGFSAKTESNDVLNGTHYGLWFNDCGMIYPMNVIRSASPPIWNNGWFEMGQNMSYDQYLYYNNAYESPPSSMDSPKSLSSSMDSPTGLHLCNRASVEEKRKCRGTEPYIPHFEHFVQRDHRYFESKREIKRADTEPKFSDENGNNSVFNLTVDEFPLLPGSNPIPIKGIEPGSLLKTEQKVKESSDSVECLEFGSLKYSPPKSMSEPNQQLDSEPTSGHFSGLEEEKESMVVELKDEKEFPPLAQPAKPEVILSKKEFPPLGISSKFDKSGKWKSFKEKKQIQSRNMS